MVACSNSINSNITGSKQNVWLTNSNSSISISNRTCSNQKNVIIIDSFYTALFSALEQTQCACM